MTTVAANSPSSAVFEKIGERLSLMQPIAAWKAKRNLPIEDLEREKVVVQSSIEKAEAAGIHGSSVKMFFEEQIAAAKEIQSCWMARWATGASKPPQSVPDLIKDVRPRLIQLGGEILETVALVLKDGEAGSFNADDEDAFVAAVEIDCLAGKSKRRIYRALMAVRLKQ